MQNTRNFAQFCSSVYSYQTIQTGSTIRFWWMNRLFAQTFFIRFSVYFCRYALLFLGLLVSCWKLINGTKKGSRKNINFHESKWKNNEEKYYERLPLLSKRFCWIFFMLCQRNFYCVILPMGWNLHYCVYNGGKRRF